jgi:hypothetical protein
MKTCHRKLGSISLHLLFAVSTLLNAQNVVYKRYIQLGDASTFGVKDQMVVAWQTEETQAE